MRRALLVALALSIAGPACSSARPEPGARVPTEPAAAVDTLPDVWVAPVGGELESLGAAVRGRVAVIDLWASWCTACRPVGERVAKLRAAYDREDLVVLGIDQGEDMEVVERHLAGRPAPYDIYVDPTLQLSDALGAKSLPTVIVVDDAGKIRRIDHGVGPEVVALVDALVRERRARVANGAASPEAPAEAR